MVWMATLASIVSGAETVPLQPLAQQVRRLEEALDYLEGRALSRPKIFGK